MIVVKRVLLLLLLAAIGSDARPGPEDCGSLSKRLPTKDLHKIFGDWALVWSVSDTQYGRDLMVNSSSSHVELQLLPDNKTILYNERNMFLDKPCTTYFFNLTMPSDLSDSENYTLPTGVGMLETDGVVRPYDDSGKVEFYETCPDCLVLVYRGTLGQFLLIYRREGQHRDVEQLKAAHGDHHELAECLGFPQDKPFIYDGAADFCHKKSSPAVEPEQSWAGWGQAGSRPGAVIKHPASLLLLFVFLSQSRMIVVKRVLLLLLLAAIGSDARPGPEDCGSLSKRLPTKDLHKIFGDWVLVWSVSDRQHGWDVLMNLSSSHVELKLLPDNKTIVYNERNMLPDKPCTTYFSNLTMPSDLSDSENYTLHISAALLETDGVVRPYDNSGTVEFYETCPDCLVLVYRDTRIQFLLIYRREGQHRDVEQQKAAHSDHHELAECLGFPQDKPFIYDGAADFCHKKSSPAVEPEQS
ncbi:saxitoxin and tetrodotoxin-binding protein 1-like [Micropterus salmoides]|uniref:saxitoxin and tetrodotoxin-binding protein 1-like n=1 Tax=Micropterus salmoides TaxID=27706 RepID=UPI0018EC1752|nr:saxitoxin and tetrodotoxin-binding protein 1-like [Micropterus salmoides]